jgi:hypothetical protein
VEALRYPIGRFQWTGKSTQEDRSKWLQIIAKTPSVLRDAIAGLTPEQLIPLIAREAGPSGRWCTITPTII